MLTIKSTLKVFKDQTIQIMFSYWAHYTTISVQMSQQTLHGVFAY